MTCPWLSGGSNHESERSFAPSKHRPLGDAVSWPRARLSSRGTARGRGDDRAAAERWGTVARLAIPALVLDRQRRLARSGSAVGRRSAAERRRETDGRDRRRRRGRRARIGRGSARRDQHDIGLHTRRDLSDAARTAVHRPHVAQCERRPNFGGHRSRRLVGRHDHRVGRVRRARAQSGEACLQRRRRVARRHRAAAACRRRRPRHGRAAEDPGSRRAGARSRPS